MMEFDAGRSSPHRQNEAFENPRIARIFFAREEWLRTSAA
jgi:hypothetical protein